MREPTNSICFVGLEVVFLGGLLLVAGVIRVVACVARIMSKIVI